MFYIDYIEKEDYIDDKSLLNKIIYWYKKYIEKLDVQYIGEFGSEYGTNVDNLSKKIKINLYDINKKTIRKLDKIINIILEENVVLSKKIYLNQLNKNQELVSYIRNKGINILKGDKIFKILFLKEIEEIIKISGLDNDIRIGILIDNIDSDFIYNLEQIAIKYKEVIVITKNENRLEKIRKKLYEEKGIIINVNNKSLFLKSDIVINYDYGEDEYYKGKKSKIVTDNIILGKCLFINYSNIKNIEDLKIKLLDGIIVNGIELDFNKKENISKEYKVFLNNLKNFDFNHIYESWILKRTKISNLLDTIEKDDIRIKQFVGIKNYISKNEFISYGNYINSNKRMNLSRRKIK